MVSGEVGLSSVPLRLSEVLGSCTVGQVWSAVDQRDRSVTVAVLEPPAADDQWWRAAFSTAYEQLGSAEAFGDLTASSPWIACPAGGPGAERIFVIMGLEYRPRLPAQFPEPAIEQPPSPSPSPDPWPDPWPPSPDSTHVPPPADLDPFLTPQTSPPGQPPLPQPIAWREPARRRTRVWIWMAALTVVVLASGGVAFVWRTASLTASPQVTPAAGVSHVALPPAVSAHPAASPLPAPPPLHPGIEPPRPGGWPAKWPRFTDTDVVRTYPYLNGLGFTVKVPPTWTCSRVDRATTGLVRYSCGAQPLVGGEIVVRRCPERCPTTRQDVMRKAEEAWGLQWIRGGHFSTWAESSTLQIDGGPRYGLVIVGFVRLGSGDGTLDHEVVIRMTAPVDGAAQVRQVASFLRDELIL
jgi:hypothetical protein